MEQFSIERAKQGGIIQTRCGFAVEILEYNTGISETPICAVVMEEITYGRKRKKRLFKKKNKTHIIIEPCPTLYHSDGRLYDDRDDDFDLVIMEDKT